MKSAAWCSYWVQNWVIDWLIDFLILPSSYRLLIVYNCKKIIKLDQSKENKTLTLQNAAKEISGQYLFYDGQVFYQFSNILKNYPYYQQISAELFDGLLGLVHISSLCL